MPPGIGYPPPMPPMMGQPPSPFGGFQPPLSPDAVRRQALMQMLDPSGGMPQGMTEPKAYPPATTTSGRRA